MMTDTKPRNPAPKYRIVQSRIPSALFAKGKQALAKQGLTWQTLVLNAVLVLVSMPGKKGVKK